MPFGHEPESGLKTAMFSGRTIHILAPLQLYCAIDGSPLRMEQRFHITLPTALRERWMSHSVGAADTEMFQHYSPHTDLIRRECRPHGQWQATACGWVQVRRRNSPPTSRRSWPCLHKVGAPTMATLPMTVKRHPPARAVPGLHPVGPGRV